MTPGRKKGSKNKSTLEHEKYRIAFEKETGKKWDDIIQAQLVDAMKNTKARHYTIDQMIGKPLDRTKVEAEITLEIDF